MNGREQLQVAPITPRAFRDTIGRFASGVTIITTRVGAHIHGMTANAVTSVSLEPMLLLVCIDRQAHLLPLIEQAGAFAVNILAADQAELSDHFAGRDRNPLAPASLQFVYATGADDDGSVPALAGCVATLRCTVEATYPGGDHQILLGRITGLQAAPPTVAPLIWVSGTYRQIAPE